jgi:membrane protein DedA with SNARE-associated domain
MTQAAQYALTHGALVLFIWILSQQLGVPIPSAPLLISVGSLASSGRIDFASSLMAALGASLLADTCWYQMGRLGWSQSDYFPLTTANWQSRALTLIKRHSGGALVASKFVASSNLVSLLAGRRRLSVPQFLLYDSIASFTWSGGYMAIGYLLQSEGHWTVAYGWHPVLSLLVATAVWSAVRLLLKSKRVSPVAKQSIHSAPAGRCWRKIRFVQESAPWHSGVGKQSTVSTFDTVLPICNFEPRFIPMN